MKVAGAYEKSMHIDNCAWEIESDTCKKGSNLMDILFEIGARTSAAFQSTKKHYFMCTTVWYGQRTLRLCGMVKEEQ